MDGQQSLQVAWVGSSDEPIKWIDACASRKLVFWVMPNVLAWINVSVDSLTVSTCFACRISSIVLEIVVGVALGPRFPFEGWLRDLSRFQIPFHSFHCPKLAISPQMKHFCRGFGIVSPVYTDLCSVCTVYLCSYAFRDISSWLGILPASIKRRRRELFNFFFILLTFKFWQIWFCFELSLKDLLEGLELVFCLEGLWDKACGQLWRTRRLGRAHREAWLRPC